MDYNKISYTALS